MSGVVQLRPPKLATLQLWHKAATFTQSVVALLEVLESSDQFNVQEGIWNTDDEWLDFEKRAKELIEGTP